MVHQTHREAVVLGQTLRQPFQAIIIRREHDHAAEMDGNMDFYIRERCNFLMYLTD